MKQVAAPAGVFITLLAIYLWTLAPGNFWIDSAAFTACNEILGLPHSPSFPLYTVLGKTAHTLLPNDPATASNLYSVVMAALGGVVLYLIIHLLLGKLTIASDIRRTASIAGALFAFLTVPIWQSAVRAEVYSLQILLSLLVIYLFLKAIADKCRTSKLKYGLAAVFIQGLSFANHSLLAVITMPLILVMPFYLKGLFSGSRFLKLGGAAIAVFCVALSFYLYLPVRSNLDPAINSGQPKTLGATINAVTRTGEDYLPAASVPGVNYPSRICKLAGFLFDQTGGLVMLGIIAGLYASFKRKDKILIALTAVIPLGLAITIWAADFKMINFDIVAYSAIPLTLLLILAFYGLSFLAEKAARKGKIGRVIPVVFVLMVFFQLSGNLYSSDLSGTAGPDRVAEIILEEAPRNAIVILNEDNIILPLWYHCLALNRRPDLAVISAGGLYRPTYRNELNILYPNLKYPPDFDSYKIENLEKAIMTFCELNKSYRPIMVQYGVPGIAASMLTPRGLLFRYGIQKDSDDIEIKNPSPQLLEYIADGSTDILTRDFIARMAFNYGAYFDQIGQVESARRFFQFAIETDEDNPQYLLQLGTAFFKAGRLEEAVLLLKEAVNTGDGCREAEELLKQINDRKFGQR